MESGPRGDRVVESSRQLTLVQPNSFMSHETDQTSARLTDKTSVDFRWLRAAVTLTATAERTANQSTGRHRTAPKTRTRPQAGR